MVGSLLIVNAKPKPEVSQSETNQNSIFSRQYWSSTDGRHQSKCFFGTYVAIFILIALASMVLFIPLINRFSLFAYHEVNSKDVPCGYSCKFELVESIPEGMTFDDRANHTSTSDAWLELIKNSTSSIEIASFYWTLRENETYSEPSSKKGEEVYQALIEAGLNRSVSVRIVQNKPDRFANNTDTALLEALGAAQVRSVDFTKLLGAGVLHTKFWIFDRKHVYIGSANMDWRALTQVKELGTVVRSCPCVAEDLAKIFEIYWAAGASDSIPSRWPSKYSTKYNFDNPLNIVTNNNTNFVYISSSPPPFSATGRTQDIDALLKTISKAEKFVYIAVMDYFPLYLYTKDYKFWPVIDNEIRRAVIERGVNVRILISQWKSTRRMIYNFANSLQSLNMINNGVTVEAKKFKVTSTPSQDKIPYARVNHNKYMVTDNGLFIGTSNWAADYFTNTAGVSFVMRTNNYTDNTLREQLLDVFERDWFSNYSRNIY